MNRKTAKLEELKEIVDDGYKAFTEEELRLCPYRDKPRRDCWWGGFFCAYYQSQEEI